MCMELLNFMTTRSSFNALHSSGRVQQQGTHALTYAHLQKSTRTHAHAHTYLYTDKSTLFGMLPHVHVRSRHWLASHTHMHACTLHLVVTRTPKHLESFNLALWVFLFLKTWQPTEKFMLAAKKARYLQLQLHVEIRNSDGLKSCKLQKACPRSVHPRNT